MEDRRGRPRHRPDRTGPRRRRRRCRRRCSPRLSTRRTSRISTIVRGTPTPTGRARLQLDRADWATDAVLVFSSGTTGLPKAVRHTHRSIGHATADWCAVLGLGHTDRFQVTTPPSHILGLLNLLAATSAGATVRLHKRFDLDEVLRYIASERMTLEMAVAPIALAMANHPRLEEYDLSSLRYIMWGATPVSESVAEVVTERTGVRWLPGYGASEVPVIAVNPVERPDLWRLDSAGLPPRGSSCGSRTLTRGGRDGSGHRRDPGPQPVGDGRLPARRGHGGRVRRRLVPHGDVGWLEPEGWVHLTDRSKEMIKVNGFQVAPAELEAVLHGHPGVLDCAVFGIADDRPAKCPWPQCSSTRPPRRRRRTSAAGRRLTGHV